MANISSHAKNQPSRCFGKAFSWYLFYQRVASKGNTWKMRMWSYLGSKALNQKPKDKVSLIFLFLAHEPRYWPFLPLMIAQTLHLSFKIRNVHISAPGPQNRKVRLLCFLKTWRKESVLSFLLKASEPRYSHRLIFYVCPFDAALWK